MTKIVIVVLLLAMIGSLAMGLFHLLKTPDQRQSGDQVVKSLTWRIGIWVVLFGFIMLSMHMGWIKPSNSVNPAKFNEAQQQRLDQKN
jgi:hypothetical protein